MSRTPPAPEEFAAMEEFVRKVRATGDSVSESLTPRERTTIDRLIDHNEHGEALVCVAWALADGETPVDPGLVATIRELSSGLVADEHLPPAFRQSFR